MMPAPGHRGGRRRDWAVVALTLAILAAALPCAMHQSDHLTAGGFSVPGSQSAEVERVLSSDYTRQAPTSLALLMWPRNGATGADIEQAISNARQAVQGLAGIAPGAEPFRLGRSAIGPVILPVPLTASKNEAENLAQTLQQRLQASSTIHDVELHLLGEDAVWAAVDEASKRDLARGEAISAPVLLLVLFLTFGSLWAAALPVALGATSVVIAGGLIYWISQVTQLSIFTTDTTSMLGLGVAVDYSLLIVTRVRQELRAGRDFEDARSIALATAGKTVLFSGLTVTVSLVGIWVIPNEALRSMALGAVLVVAISVAASVTLLPALLAIVGPRRLSTRVHVTRLILRGRRAPMDWERWARIVMQHPLLATAAAGGIMLVLSGPALEMRTSTGPLQQLSDTSEAHVGVEEAARLGGPGELGLIDVVAATPRVDDLTDLELYVSKLRSISVHSKSVVQVGRTYIAGNDADAFFTVLPSVGPETSAADHLVTYLRSAFAKALQGSDAIVIVGGASASLVDEEQQIAGHLLKLIVVVLTLAFVVLLLMLRSVVVPIKALVMNLLSIGATYGVLVIVFQWGWLDGVLHSHSPGHVDTLVPPLTLSVVFGLSMDYEVFLLSRIRERWRASGDTRGAVAEGLAASAQTISSAAFVLFCVLAVFAATGLPFIREIGVGAAVAIGLDVTLIRLTLVPAAMRLLGDWNWWWPKALDRLGQSPRSRPSSAGRAPVDTT
jgi:uncharacterized membrane protein YdfJ with MMPL/SSD domain